MDASFKFQLWQKALEYKAEPIESGEFLVTIKECIDNGFALEVLNLLSDTEYQDILDNIGWELFSILTFYVTNPEDPSYQSEIEEIIAKVVETCSPKEVILGILENFSNVRNINGFLVLLGHLKRALLRQTRQRVKFLQMVCNQSVLEIRKYTRNYVSSQQPQNNMNIGNADNNYHGNISDLPSPSQFVHKCIDFIDPFVPKLVAKDKNDILTSCQDDRNQPIVLNFICELLDNPMSWLSSTDKNIAETENQLLEEFFRSCGHFVDVLMQANDYTKDSCLVDAGLDEEICRVSRAGIGNLLYLILVRERCTYCLPFVLRSGFLASCSLQPLVALLDRKDEVCIEKGLTLSKNILSRIEDGNLSHRDTKMDRVKSLLKCLMNIAVWCQERELRKMAAEQITLVIYKVDLKHRFELISSSLEITDHSGVAGLLIHCMKDNILQSIQSMHLKNFIHSEKSLFNFVELAFEPLSQRKADVIQDVDRLLSALNLLRFVFAKASSGEDQTGLCSHIPDIENTFLEPLRFAIQQSRINHKEFLKDKTEKNTPDAVKNGIDFSVSTLQGMLIEEIPIKERLQMVEIGLSTLDVMESVIARISEIIDTVPSSLRSR